MHTFQSYLEHRRDNFLVLRIVAALLVIYGHSFALTHQEGLTDIFLRHGWPFYSGDMAVMMFFVISGYMVAGSYLGRQNLFEFATARLLRIVPALVFVLVASALGGLVLTTLDANEYARSPQVYAYVTQNLQFSSEMAWELPGVFTDHTRTSVNGSLWTLPAEMRMYVLVAVFGVLGLLGSPRLGLTALAALIVAGIVNPRLLPVHGDWLRLGAFFCAGMAAQLYKDRLQARHDVMLVLAFLAYISYHTAAFYWLLGLAIAYFCFWFAYRTPYLDLERFGDPSYGIYLWGWPIQQLLLSLNPEMKPFLNFVASALLAIVMGWISWRVVERPAMSLKRHVKHSVRWLTTRFTPAANGA